MLQCSLKYGFGQKSLSLLMVLFRIEYFLGLRKNNKIKKKLSHVSLKFGVGMENVDLCFGQTCYLVFVLLPCRPLVILVSDLRARQITTAMGFILGALDNIWGVKLK